jgi:tetratricopeptide (TPR) repeat protein
MAGQLLITALDRPGVDRDAVAHAARTFFESGLDADPRCIDCLFGLLVLDLHLDRQPDPALIGRLAEALRSGHVDATNTSTAQFSYLVRWHRSDGIKLAPEQLRAIFDAALANPGWNNTGRAGIASAYREYFELVAGDLDSALQQAEAAIRSWPAQWSYHMQKVEVLRKLGRRADALAALDRAAPLTENETQRERMAKVRTELESLQAD